MNDDKHFSLPKEFPFFHRLFLGFQVWIMEHLHVTSFSLFYAHARLLKKKMKKKNRSFNPGSIQSSNIYISLVPLSRVGSIVLLWSSGFRSISTQFWIISNQTEVRTQFRDFAAFASRAYRRPRVQCSAPPVQSWSINWSICRLTFGCFASINTQHSSSTILARTSIDMFSS